MRFWLRISFRVVYKHSLSRRGSDSMQSDQLMMANCLMSFLPEDSIDVAMMASRSSDMFMFRPSKGLPNPECVNRCRNLQGI